LTREKKVAAMPTIDNLRALKRDHCDFHVHEHGQVGAPQEHSRLAALQVKCGIKIDRRVFGDLNERVDWFVAPCRQEHSVQAVIPAHYESRVSK
jgi:hypothetical protein